MRARARRVYRVGMCSPTGRSSFLSSIEYDGSTHIDLDFDLDNLSWGVANTAVGLDEECRPTGLPWGLDQTIAGVCE